MSLSDHLDTLAAYHPTAVRIVGRDGQTEDLVGQGGGLAERLEELGQGSLVGVLRDPDVAQVLLVDGDLEITLERSAGLGRLRVTWGQTAVIDELVPIPLVDARPVGPRLRPLPDGDVDDLPAALVDPEQELWAVRDGSGVRWVRRAAHGDGVGAFDVVGWVPRLDVDVFSAGGALATWGLSSGLAACVDVDEALAIQGSMVLPLIEPGELDPDALDARLAEATGAPLGLVVRDASWMDLVQRRGLVAYLPAGSDGLWPSIESTRVILEVTAGVIPRLLEPRHPDAVVVASPDLLAWARSHLADTTVLGLGPVRTAVGVWAAWSAGAQLVVLHADEPAEQLVQRALHHARVALARLVGG